jgi:hypothetical protein
MAASPEDAFNELWQRPFVLDREAHRARAEQIDKDAGEAYQNGMAWLYDVLERTQGDPSLLALRAALQTRYNSVVAVTACLTTFGGSSADNGIADALLRGDNLDVTLYLHAARRACLQLQALSQALYELWRDVCDEQQL